MAAAGQARGDITTSADLDRLLRHFYAQVFADELACSHAARTAENFLRNLNAAEPRRSLCLLHSPSSAADRP